MIEPGADPLIADRADCRRIFEDSLRDAGAGTLARSLADGIVESLERVELPSRPPPPGTFGLIVPRFNYIVRTRDLDRHRHTVGLLVALVSLGHVHVEMNPAALVAFAAALASLVEATWRRGAVVDPLQMWVLVALQRHGPLTVVQLAERMSSAGPRYTVDDAGRVLASLERVRSINGEILAVVARAADDCWWTVDLGGTSVSSSMGQGLRRAATEGPTPREELCRLLASCMVDPAALRRFVAFLSPDENLADRLRERSSLCEIADEVVSLLEGEGLLASCFERLLSEFSGRAGEVKAIRDRYFPPGT